MKLVHICGRVYENLDDSPGPVSHVHDEMNLCRFMDKFYIQCATDELNTNEVFELCRARAKRPEAISAVNSSVRGILRSLMHEIRPTRMLEIGAGSNPIFQSITPAPSGMDFFTADADPQIAAEGPTNLSWSDCRLPCADNYFDAAAAVFVLHFPFDELQVAELYRCLSPKGVFVANIYRRSEQSRTNLADAFRRAGFTVNIVDDAQKLCRNHEYWVVGKNTIRAEEAVQILRRLTAAGASGVR